MSDYGVFDAIVVYSAPGVEPVSIARALGPLERGSFDDGTWIPAAGPTAVITEKFGVGPGGDPYYDTDAVDPGDEESLFVDGRSGQLWLGAV